MGREVKSSRGRKGQKEGESRETEAGHEHVEREGREWEGKGEGKSPRGQERSKREARVREGGGGKQPLL